MKKVRLGALYSVLILYTLIGTLDVEASNALIDSDAYKVFWYRPLSLEQSADASWIEVAACQGDICDKRIDRFSLKDAKINGSFSIEHSTSESTLVWHGEDSDPILIASSLYQHHWFPKVEICRVEEQQRCRVEIERSSSNKKLSVRLFRK